MKIQIDQERLNREIDTLSSFSDSEAPAVTRIVFSRQDLKARAWLKERFAEAGLTVREDAVGNTFARWNGANPNLAAVATGSHVDAIPYAGKYDGVVGVLGGLEAIRALQHAGFTPVRPIELILFTSEEPTRFGLGCLGSRLMSGTLDPKQAAALRDSEGETLDSVRQQAGFTGPLDSVRMAPGAYSAFVELHIEQGPILEQEKIPLGLVTHIAAPASFRITIEGEGGHAGARLMPGRRDALCAAAEMVLAIEQAALATGAIDTVGTVGICQVHPGAVNSIPSRVQLSLDLRDTDTARRDRAQAEIKAHLDEIAQRRRVSVAMETINSDPPAESSTEILAALTAACQAEGIPHRRMVSRAYHDSSFMSQIAPIAMLFIPCRAGVSHRPDEYSSPEDIGRGVTVLARTLATLSGASPV
ncbi:MAG: M20 family metallo-hydrolase [Acidobacteriaceae bacterium]|nr:M20 family metallo-hydrolase [Acidobacteriaceae bacterium]